MQPIITADMTVVQHIASLLSRGPLARRIAKPTGPVQIKVTGGKVGDWSTWDVLDALSWMAGRHLNMIDGYDGEEADDTGEGFITVWPKGSRAVAAA